MKVSIGILAHNEAATIRKTLVSLLQQSLFHTAHPDRQVEIICVPNGCSDDTAAVACATLEELINPQDFPHVSWKVCDLRQPGKPNAWNHYVHQFSDPQSDYLFLMDADIWFPDGMTLLPMLELLENRTDVWVSVDRPVKDVLLKSNKNLAEHLSTFVSELSGSDGAVWLCGQLYCARADILRQIYFPSELTADDGFLYQMVATNCLTTPVQQERIARAPNTLHVFEAYTHPKQLLRHERWLLVASITNALIFQHLQHYLNQTTDARSEPSAVAKLFRQWDQQNPEWVSQLIRAERRKQSGWLSPPEFLNRRFVNLRHKPWWQAVLLLPLAVVAMGVDLLALYAANRELAKL